MQVVPNFVIVIFLTLTAWIPASVICYCRDKKLYDAGNKEVAEQEYPDSIIVFIVVIIASAAAIWAFGTHKGYWLIASLITIVATCLFSKYIWKKFSGKVNPFLPGAYYPIFFGDIFFFVTMLFIYWLVAIKMGIAAENSLLQFKF